MRNFVLGDDPIRIVDSTATITDRSVVKLTTGQIGVVFGGNLYLRTEVIPLSEVQIEKVWDYPTLYESIDSVSKLMPPIFDSVDVDWNNVPVDTKIEVRINGVWKHAFFAGCYGGVPYYFLNGKSSFTVVMDKIGAMSVIDKKDIRLFKKGL